MCKSMRMTETEHFRPGLGLLDAPCCKALEGMKKNPNFQFEPLSNGQAV